MRVGEHRRLACETIIIDSIDDYVLPASRGATVLNVGAAGGVDQYLPSHPEDWMHAKLRGVAAELVGLDIDRSGIDLAREHGYEIVQGDCQSVRLARRFDVIIMSDVIEHLERPGEALGNLVDHLAPGGRLLVTTPNATFVGGFIDAIRNQPVDVYWDHVTVFVPEHIQTLCERHHLVLRRVAFFTFQDRRTHSNRWKSTVVRAIGRIRPRLHGHFLAEIAAKPGA